LKAITNTLVSKVDTTKTVNLVFVLNPLMPTESREIYNRPWIDEPLTTYVGELEGEWVIHSTSMGELTPEQCSEFKPKPGDFVVMIPVLGGGDGGGKQVLRIVAMIALTFATGGIASGTFLTGLNSGQALFAAAAIQIGGTLLINAVLPVTAPESDDLSSQQAYGLDGPKNVSTEGIPFPLVYGEHWVGGNIISMFVDNVGGNQQYLNMLICLSEGEIDQILEVTINDQPSSSYRDVYIQPRKGLASQEVLQFFGDVVRPVNRNQQVPTQSGAAWNDTETIRQNFLKNGVDSMVHVTTGSASRIRLDVSFPIGLGVQHNNGDFSQGLSQEDGCNFVLGYRESGTTDDFTPFGFHATGVNAVNSVTFNNGDSEGDVDGNYVPAEDNYQPIDFLAEVAGRGYEIESPSAPRTLGITARGNSKTALRKSYYSGELDTSKRYEIKIYNSQTDDVNVTRRHNVLFVTDINETLHDDIQYNHTALLGLRIRLSDQINGIPKVLTRLRGIKCPVYNEATQSFDIAWTDNPAWITYEAMTNTRYGGQIPAEKIKLSYWREWAQFCETNNLKFNGSLPEASNLYDALKPVFRVGRARLVRAGSRFQLAIESVRPQSMLFTMGNIKKGTLNVSWSSASERANEVHVKYYDKNDFNKQTTLIVQDNVARIRGDDAKSTDLDLRGVDNFEQASKEGTFALNMNKLMRSVSFQAPIEAIALTIGDVFGLQHDMPSWGQGGLTAPGSTASVIQLGNTVNMTGGASYEILIKQDVVTSHVNTVSQVSSGIVYLNSAFDPNALPSMQRLLNVTSGEERAIEEYWFDGSLGWGVVVSDDSNIVAGNTINLLSTDVIETASVMYSAGDSTSVTLQGPASSAPEPYSSYAFGEVGSVIKYFTCQSISGDSDSHKTISGLEYLEAAFSDVPLNVTSPTRVEYATITNVDFTGFSQSSSNFANNPTEIVVKATWTTESEIYDHAEVLLYKNNLVRNLGVFIDQVSFEAVEGDLITIAIVPVDKYGNKPDVILVNHHEYTVSNQFVTDSPQNLLIETDLTLSTSNNYQTEVIFSFDPPDDTYHIIAYEVEHQMARHLDWTPLAYGLETTHKLSTSEFGIIQFRVRTVYVKGEFYSDWGYVQVNSAGTLTDISVIGMDDPINPKLFISTNQTKVTADIGIEVDQFTSSGAFPSNLFLFYSWDDRPNSLGIGTDAGDKLYLSPTTNDGKIAGQFDLDVIAGSSTTEIRYVDPLDTVDIDLSGLWWVSVISGANGQTRFFKVHGVTTSEIQLAPGDALPYTPQAGDTVSVIEIDWHDSRLNEFKLGWVDGEVIRHDGLEFDANTSNYYINALERGAEGTTQQDASNKVLHYYPAFGPDTIAVKIEMSQFSLVDGVYKYNQSLSLDIPPNMEWASVTCCYVREGTTEEGSAYVRSNIVALEVAER
jgi:predicted phage tail protein